jgi:small-conductance mechanosensitive channel
MVILRLNRLIESGPENPRWKMILVAAAVLGAVVWWLVRQLVTNRIVAWSLFTLGGLILFLRIADPETLSGGFLPTSETPGALFATMEEAIRYIRNGVPPIDPVVGVIAILAVLMWVVGALFVWGSWRPSSFPRRFSICSSRSSTVRLPGWVG